MAFAAYNPHRKCPPDKPYRCIHKKQLTANKINITFTGISARQLPDNCAETEIQQTSVELLLMIENPGGGVYFAKYTDASLRGEYTSTLQENIDSFEQCTDRCVAGCFAVRFNRAVLTCELVQDVDANTRLETYAPDHELTDTWAQHIGFDIGIKTPSNDKTVSAKNDAIPKIEVEVVFPLISWTAINKQNVHSYCIIKCMERPWCTGIKQINNNQCAMYKSTTKRNDQNVINDNRYQIHRVVQYESCASNKIGRAHV